MSVENIINIYNLSTPAERRRGLAWYATAFTDCERIANQFGLPVNIVAGVVSALSPNNKWERNIENPTMSDDEIAKVLNGQKIISFFRCILGYDTCCIDGHAKGIYEGKRFGLTSPKNHISKKYYKQLQDAYVEAGSKITFRKKNLRAFEIQAITWVTWKRIHDI